MTTTTQSTSRPPAAALAEVRAMALWLAGHGVPVFPLAVGAKVPTAGTAGFKDASTDPVQVASWWERTPFNVGVSTGPARLVVVDLDPPKTDKETGELVELPEPFASMPGVRDGADVFAVLAAEAGQPVPLDTRTVATPSGGLHLYFTAPHPLPSTQSKLGPLIDTRAMGGYVVAPPSRTELGAYVTLNSAPIRPLPAWLVDALTPAPPAGATTNPTGHTPGARRTPAPRGPVTDPYVLAAFENEVDAVLAARPGTRNASLNRAAFSLGQFVAAGRLNEGQVVEVLTIAGEHIGLSPGEVARTIASGLAAAVHQPRPDHQLTHTTTAGAYGHGRHA